MTSKRLSEPATINIFHSLISFSLRREELGCRSEPATSTLQVDERVKILIWIENDFFEPKLMTTGRLLGRLAALSARWDWKQRATALFDHRQRAQHWSRRAARFFLLYVVEFSLSLRRPFALPFFSPRAVRFVLFTQCSAALRTFTISTNNRVVCFTFFFLLQQTRVSLAGLSSYSTQFSVSVSVFAQRFTDEQRFARPIRDSFFTWGKKDIYKLNIKSELFQMF